VGGVSEKTLIPTFSREREKGHARAGLLLPPLPLAGKGASLSPLPLAGEGRVRAFLLLVKYA
jgi:hypothetical protein